MALLKFTLATNGGDRERTFRIADDGVSIGRAPDNDIVIPNESVSRCHVRIRKTPQGYLLVDNDSMNGVFLRNEKIHQRLLQHGDVFRIEEVSFRFLQPPSHELSAASSSKIAESEATIECSSCGASVRGALRFCTVCGAKLVRPEKGGKRPPIRESSRRKAPARAVLAATVYVVVAGAVLAAGVLGARFLSVGQSASSSLTGLAPELAPYGELARLRGSPQSFTAGSKGGSTTLSDGARIEVPEGVLDQEVTFQGAVIDLELKRRSADVSSARVYMVATEGKTGPLSEPVVLEVPVAVSSEVSFAWYDGTEWLSFPVPEGPKARIQFRSFSRRYVAFVKWSKSPQGSTGATPAPSAEAGGGGGPVDILNPSATAQVLSYLNRYLNWYGSADFSKVVSLGDREAIRSASAELEVEIVPSLGRMGKYTPKQARWFGSFRSHLLEVKELKEDFAALKTLWHEYLHHMVNLRGGEACGPEEAYMDLLETRADWLNLVNASLDRYMKNVDTVDSDVCNQIQRRWEKLASLWENTRGNPLSGPYRWQDPKADNSCGEPDQFYTISADFIATWDRKLGIDIDAEKIRSFYEQKIWSLPKSGLSDCSLKKVSPPAAPQSEPSTSPAPSPPPKQTSALPSGERDVKPCPVVENVLQKCAWSPEGYKVDPCPPGYCFDTGPRGSYICVQIDPIDNGRRSYTGRMICNEGYSAVTDPCSGLILECVQRN